MGDSIEGEIFMTSYYAHMDQYRTRTFFTGSDQLLATSAIMPDVPSDLSLPAFVDDVLRFIPITNLNFRSRCNNDAIEISRSLRRGYYFQNLGKADIAFYSSNRQHLRRMINDARTVGRKSTNLKHFGTWPSTFGGNTEDIRARLKVQNTGWIRMGLFWFSDTPWNLRCRVFYALVASPAYSALEGTRIRPAECIQIDRCLVVKLRAMMKGKACERGASDEWFQKMPDGEVMRRARIAPTALELVVRRLSLFQELVKRPCQHTHLINAMFGEMRCEAIARARGDQVMQRTLAPDGSISAGAHGLARQLADDIEILCNAECGAELASDWCDRSMTRLFADASLVATLCAIDVSTLRKASFTTAWAPDGLLRSAMDDAEEASSADNLTNVPEIHICNIKF